MTHEEALKKAETFSLGKDWDNPKIYAQIAGLILDSRNEAIEECAKVCEKVKFGAEKKNKVSMLNAQIICASHIRFLKTP